MPRSLKGENTADLGPIMTWAWPSAIRSHSIARCFSVSWEWRIAVWLPNTFLK